MSKGSTCTDVEASIVPAPLNSDLQVFVVAPRVAWVGSVPQISGCSIPHLLHQGQAACPVGLPPTPHLYVGKHHEALISAYFQGTHLSSLKI